MHTFHFGLSPRLLSLLHGHSPPSPALAKAGVVPAKAGTQP